MYYFQVYFLIKFNFFGVHRAIGCGQKKLHASVVVPAASVRVPSQRPLAPSVATVTSVANDKGHNEMTLGLCTELLEFAL